MRLLPLLTMMRRMMTGWCTGPSHYPTSSWLPLLNVDTLKNFSLSLATLANPSSLLFSDDFFMKRLNHHPPLRHRPLLRSQ
ncbi:hypothetical protein B0H10DRAFT_2078314 [Mycena sp. CBHHK59/15]|nr:hypothetical protein B0H10DRAFT_2078314 [Mycena sp. CBHHK59/15]